MTHTYKNYITDDFWYHEGRLSALERLHAGVTTGVCVLGSQPRCDSPVPAFNNARAYAEVGVKDIVCTGPAMCRGLTDSAAIRRTERGICPRLAMRLC